MNVLIIGKDSYIGNHIDKWLSAKGWTVSQLDVLTDAWKTFDYSPYDAIVHVAAIVHRPDCTDWSLYQSVNTDLPIAIASKAKEQGTTRSYVYLSSMAVYGRGKELRPNVIDENTPLGADSLYGKSKWMAEQGLAQLQSDHFHVVAVRPPSVYGKGCKGNYISGFASVAGKLPVFPLAYEKVKQSMLYIDNLCEFIYLAIEKNLSGAFCPQDDKAVSAVEILNAIAKSQGMSKPNSRLLGFFVPLFRFLPLVKKAYGGLAYSKALSTLEGIDYVVVPFDEGMRRTIA